MQAEETSEAYKGLTEFLQRTLGERVEKVAVSRRLADSPCALVTSKFGWSAYQERIMKSQVRLASSVPYILLGLSLNRHDSLCLDACACSHRIGGDFDAIALWQMHQLSHQLA